MANFLSCIVEAESPERASAIAGLLGRQTRPIFVEDVPDRLEPEFALIEPLEYPDALVVEGQRFIASWFEKDRLTFRDLGPLWKLDGLGLVLAYERDTYEGSEDDGDSGDRYWIQTDGEPAAIAARAFEATNFETELMWIRSQLPQD